MKKVILICLLSLSVCLSEPQQPGVTKSLPAQANSEAVSQQNQVDPNKPHTKVLDTKPISEINANTVQPSSSVLPKEAPINITPTNTTPTNTTPTNTTPTNITPTTNKTTITNKEDSPINATSNTSATIPAQPKTNNTLPIDTNTKISPSTTQAQKDATTQSANDKQSSTLKPDSKPTEAPTKEGDKIVQARGFDGASFIGGIILTLGLLAIGFMGFKYYKNQTERNYHTL